MNILWELFKILTSGQHNHPTALDREHPELSEREYYQLKARKVEEASLSPAERIVRDRRKPFREKFDSARAHVERAYPEISDPKRHLLEAIDKLDAGCEKNFEEQLKLIQRIDVLNTVEELRSEIDGLMPVTDESRIALLEDEIALVKATGARLKALRVQNERATTSVDEFVVMLAIADDRSEAIEESVDQLDEIVERTLRYLDT